MKWISVKDELPEVYEEVCFIVESKDKIYDKRRMGGMYQGFKFGYHGFSVPGIEFKGSYWCRFPDLPESLQK